MANTTRPHKQAHISNGIDVHDKLHMYGAVLDRFSDVAMCKCNKDAAIYFKLAMYFRRS